MDQINTNIEDIKNIISPNSFIPMQTKKETKQVNFADATDQLNQLNKTKFTKLTGILKSKNEQEFLSGSPNTSDSLDLPNSPISTKSTDSIDKIADNNNLLWGNSHFISLFGLNMPRHTFYLIIILFILGIMIWYLNSDTRKNKKKIIEEKNDD